MTRLALLGCTHVSDLYPNVRYKIALLTQHQDLPVKSVIYDLGEGGLYRSYRQPWWLRLCSLLRLLWGTLSVFLRFVLQPCRKVYVLYPSLPLVLCLGCLPPFLRPRIYLDAFISLYDTVVNDRRLLPESHWLARLLFLCERRSFRLATRVLVDTDENARFYADLYDLPVTRFRTVRLSIPALRAEPGLERDAVMFRCVFIGSLVPLHGIDTILAALSQLHSFERLQLQVIGDGQDATLLQRFQSAHPQAPLRWDKGFYPAGYLAQAITQADLCLGVFGDSAKAQRVVPYKLYYYAALGAPFLTLATPAVRALCGDDADLLTVAPGHEALAEAVAACIRDPARVQAMRQASQRLYQEQLGDAAVYAQLLDALDMNSKVSE